MHIRWIVISFRQPFKIYFFFAYNIDYYTEEKNNTVGLTNKVYLIEVS